MNTYVHYLLGLLLLVTVMRVDHFMHSSNEALAPTVMTEGTAGISSLGEFQNGKNADKRFLKDDSPDFVIPKIKQKIEEPVDNASEAEQIDEIGETLQAQEDTNKQTEGEQNTSEVKREPNIVYIPLPKTTDDLDNAISKLATFFKLRYQGKWTYDTEGLVGEAGGVSEFMAAVHNITTPEGRMAKVNFGIQLLQGKLRENVDGYHVSFELSNYTVSEKSITIEAINAEVTKERIQLFTKSDNGYCTANVTLVFTEKEGNIFEGLISLKSKHKHCVVESTSLVSSQFEELINQQRGMNYNIILFMILCFYCYAMIKQIKKVEDNEGIAKRFSIITIGWNIIWNFCFFNIYITYSFMIPLNNQLMAPAFFYFMICFLFELKLLLLCWKAENMDAIEEGPNAARRALIFFYCKFYCICLAFFFLIDSIFRFSFVLLIANGLIWVPQIYKNCLTKARNTPDVKFVISMTLSQCFLPLYLRGCPNNIFLSETSYIWSFIFVSVVGLQVLILYLQRKLGARFFLPDKYKYWNEYNYYRNLEESDMEDGETECCVCLNNLATLDSESGEGQDGYRRIVYMQTPCDHKFHTDCLKPWMQQKLQCPKCRADLPALDEEDF